MSDTLVLDITGNPVAFVSWQRAVNLAWADRATVLAEDSEVILRSPSFEMNMPRVVQIKNRVAKGLRTAVPMTRRNIAIRDESKCQYCGKVLKTHEYTLDHVIPRCQGGESTWENLVICCVKCNKYKDRHTPKEAGMELLRKPVEPSVWDKRFNFRLHIDKLRPEWEPWESWLYWNVKLEK